MVLKLNFWQPLKLIIIYLIIVLKSIHYSLNIWSGLSVSIYFILQKLEKFFFLFFHHFLLKSSKTFIKKHQGKWDFIMMLFLHKFSHTHMYYTRYTRFFIKYWDWMYCFYSRKPLAERLCSSCARIFHHVSQKSAGLYSAPFSHTDSLMWSVCVRSSKTENVWKHGGANLYQFLL